MRLRALSIQSPSHPQSSAKISSRRWKLKKLSKPLIVSAQYSQAQDFLTSRLQDFKTFPQSGHQSALVHEEQWGWFKEFKLSLVLVFIASAPTLFPPEYVEEFQKCFDRAPPVPFEDIKSILIQELGRPIDSVYEYIDPMPIASASIAQVHGARLVGSQDYVVIKVLKPGVEDVLVADLNFIYIVARILEFLNPELDRTSLECNKNK
ncbi:putative aarF domain-containing protein [Drosera capensis]